MEQQDRSKQPNRKNETTNDAEFAETFDTVANTLDIPIRFTLDNDRLLLYCPLPERESGGHFLKSAASVLAIHCYLNEGSSGLVKNGPQCFDPDWHNCHPYDNNKPIE